MDTAAELRELVVAETTLEADHGLRIEQAEGRKLRLVPEAEDNEIRIVPRADWSAAQYLVWDAYYDYEQAGVTRFRVFARGEATARIEIRISLMPRTWTRLAIPLSVLDGQTVFLRRTPLRLKATLKGTRTRQQDVSHFTLTVAPNDGPSALVVSDPLLLSAEPPYLVPDGILVDELGQWTARDWPGKTHDLDELQRKLFTARTAAANSGFRPDWNEFGGSTRHRFDASGYFRTERRDGRWWLVDPSGCGFFSAGLDAVIPGDGAAIVPGTEKLFAFLPPKDGPYAEAWKFEGRMNVETFAFPVANLIRVFGDHWRAAWTKITAARLRNWGFNTVAAFSDLQFARASGLPYTLRLPRFPQTKVHLFRDLPDVFDPEYERDARECAEPLREYADDPRVLGYFPRNEPLWAFGKYNLASAMLEANPGTATRREFSRWLEGRYAGDVATWSRAWNRPFESFRQTETDLLHQVEHLSPQAQKDTWEFSKVIARRYVEVACRPLREVLPHHMNLGMRYAWISSELCYEGSDFYDVFTINNYNMEPPLRTIAEVARASGKPVLLGEWHHGATDRGLPASGLRRVPTQHDRGVAYRRYLELCAADPNCVGAHYFKLGDQSVLGRFDGENYQIGLIDCCHQPYDEMIAEVRKSHDRIYDVASGAEQPTELRAPELPRIY